MISLIKKNAVTITRKRGIPQNMSFRVLVYSEAKTSERNLKERNPAKPDKTTSRRIGCVKNLSPNLVFKESSLRKNLNNLISLLVQTDFSQVLELIV
jgi:hypothetical protein